MDQKKYVKLKDLIGDTFVLKKVWGYKWKMWNDAEGRFVEVDKPQKGFSQKWQVETDKGELELSSFQFNDMLSRSWDNKEQKSTPVGRTFSVKSNGKDGMDIRYYINLVYGDRPTTPEPAPQTDRSPDMDFTPQDIQDEPVDLSGIPF